MRSAVVTVFSPNYRHHARVLMASLARHHPEWERFGVLVGETTPPPDEPNFTTLTFAELNVPSPRQLCFRYTLFELDTALKPWAIEHVFARGFDQVIYFDPDIQLHSPLHELAALPPETALVLTPHVTRPGAKDPHCPERGLLLAGTYNLGFLAVRRRPQLAAFLAWWQSKLEHHCLNEQHRGLFVDQRWMDLAPALFDEVCILRHEGYNLAYWNLGRRPLRRSDDGWHTHSGAALRFVHFSGFAGRAPDALSTHSALTLAEIGEARALFDDYDAALIAAGRDTYQGAAYAYASFVDGSPVTDWMRRAYRETPSLQAAAGPDPWQHPELFEGSLVARAHVTLRALVGSARGAARKIPHPLRAPLRELYRSFRPPRSRWRRPAARARTP